MLPVKTTQPYTKAGMFGAVRKYDIHTGLDLYCKEDSDIIAIESGRVIEVIPFTGIEAGSPWWMDTKAVVIQSGERVLVYGEVAPIVSVGDNVTIGQSIASSKRVLKKDKGINPSCMLHLEVWENYYSSNYTWGLGQPKPKGLSNPLSLLCYWIIKTPYGYRIETHDGKYWEHFASAVDCKAQCMYRSEFYGEKYCYTNTPTNKRDYTLATGKSL